MKLLYNFCSKGISLNKMEKTTNFFKNLNFQNSAFNNLRVEDEQAVNEPRKVRGYHFSQVKPQIRKNPRILAMSKTAMELLDLDSDLLQKEENDLNEYLCGNKIPEKAKVMAHNYCGFQFGNWANQLGDGRAHILGDIKNSKEQIWELQFKGSGKTPYSRFADGGAVLRSSIREFLCSEGMHYLGIPTTRAGSLVLTDDTVDRDPIYNGKVIQEKCCVVLRISPSFLRFGSFQICIQGAPGDVAPSYGMEETMIKGLLNYVIEYHYPKIYQEYKLCEEGYFEFFKELTNRTAKMVALWQTVGFVHGVLNTDNMSVLGLTIDYGPYEFVDHFSKKHIGNYSDKSGRYSYENQPAVCKWNLIKLAEALHPFVNLMATKDYVETFYDKVYQQEYYGRMKQKLGLNTNNEGDRKLIDELFDTMDATSAEFTNTFRSLANILITPDFKDELTQGDIDVLKELISLSPDKAYLEEKLKPQIPLEKIVQLQAMYKVNPYQLMMMGVDEEFLEINYKKALKYDEFKNSDDMGLQKQFTWTWQEWLIKYKQRLVLEYNKDMDIDQQNQERKKNMNLVNPKYVLRNYMAEQIIVEANKGNFNDINYMLELLQNPYGQTDGENQVCKIQQKVTPKWATGLCVSCSS